MIPSPSSPGCFLTEAQRKQELCVPCSPTRVLQTWRVAGSGPRVWLEATAVGPRQCTGPDPGNACLWFSRALRGKDVA